MKKISAILLALVLCISVLAIPAFAAFDTVNSLALVGSGIPGTKADWDPADPAGDMTEVSDGIYEKTLDLDAGATMTFKVAGNDTWDDSCNFGNGAALELGTVADLPISTFGGDMTFTADEAMTIKITVDLTADAATILVEKAGAETPDKPTETPDAPVETPDETPDAPTTTPSEGNVFVHAFVPDKISPCFWAWESATQKNAFAAWPGEAMTKDGDWWTIEVPNWCDGMIVNDGGSGEQTQDITVELGKEVWIVINPFDWKSSVAYYELPNLEEVLPSEPPVVELPEVSRPTVGNTTAATNPTVKTDKADKAGESEEAKVVALGMTFTKKTQALIIIGTAVLAVIAIAFVLSIPKKIK